MEVVMTTQQPTGGTMRAVIQAGSGSADVLQLREIERPALAEGSVLVRVRATSVNAADYHTVHGGRLVSLVGTLMRMRSSPIRGIDVAGTVEAVGANVTKLRPGDDVFGVGAGTFAEYAIGSERGLLPKPAQLSFAEAACMGVAALTALQGLRDHGKLKAGDRALVFGAGGGVGTFAVQIAKALGAHVTAVTGPANIEIVGRLGADEVVDYTVEDVLRRRPKFDVVLDVAAIRSIRQLHRAVAPTGTVVLVGADKRGGASLFGRIIAGLLRARVLRQRVVFFIAKTKHDDLAFLASLVEQGKLRPAIDREYPLSEVREAVRYAMSGEARAKVVITVGEDVSVTTTKAIGS
jgi:NADPH:quinone reductase-like Zn-dependent oxidoreductase